MTGTANALDVLDSPRPTLPGTVVLFGPQRYLQSLVLKYLTGDGSADGDPFVAGFEGDSAEWPVLADQLRSQSLFGGENKLVLVRDADDFVKRHRERLEDLVVTDTNRSVPLVLTVLAWPANTRLFKQIDKSGWQIACDLPQTGRGWSGSTDFARVGKWLAKRAAIEYQFRLDPDAGRLLIELCDEDLGRADQELARIAVSVAENETVDRQKLQSMVGGWRSQTIYEAIDAALEGQPAIALQLFDRLLRAGEEPFGLFAQLAWSLRRYAQAMRHLDRSGGGKTAMRAALEQAGFKNFRSELDRAEPRMRRLGRPRVEKLSAVLLEIDRALKGSHSREDRGRLALEKLIFWLA
jgi:DNA polymerase III subunit delta